MKNHPSLFSGALRQYGSWNAALVASLSKKELPGNSYQSRLQLLRTLRDCLEMKRKRRISQAVKRQAAYYFGSLEKAIVALKRDQQIFGWLEQAKNHQNPFPDAPIQKESCLR
jgi:hypothetical protein